jgi:ubiquinone/menaquinone biosynthesis C-methylase UbiE
MAALGATELAIDLGTGDGAYVLRRAQAEPATFFVGIDSVVDNLSKAARKGRVPNALFVRASAEALPDELAGLAGGVTVLLPWGSLLRAVLEPDVAVLAGIRRLCRPGATLLVVAGEPATASIVPAYAAAGFAAGVRVITASEVRQLRTTWAARLAFGRPRTFTEISAAAI